MRFFLAIAVFILIAVLHAIPSQDFPEFSFTEIFQVDKLIHAFLFAIGFFTAAIALPMQYQVKLLRYTVIVYILYGAFLEIAQQLFFENRHADVLDWLADIIGVFIGLFLFRKLKYLFK